MTVKRILFAAGVAAMSASAAHAALSVSSKPTANVTCAANACTATARKANLNVDELAAMLAGADVALTAGHGKDIDILDALTWSSAHKLTLNARLIAFKAATISEGPGGVEIHASVRTDFEARGRLAFWDTGANLSINGANYVLAASIATLASALQANPNGHVALANDYDAAQDGTYHAAPLDVDAFQGVLNGLGNTIGGLKIHNPQSGQHLGLFKDVFGLVLDLRLTKAKIAGGPSSAIGGLAGACNAIVDDVSVAGRISGGAGSSVGGLCGQVSNVLVTRSHASGTVTGSGDGGLAGGLTGSASGTGAAVTASWSIANVRGGTNWHIGGLIGQNSAVVNEAYASGTVLVGDGGFSGGLIGDNTGSVLQTYAKGTVQGTLNTMVGGLAGRNDGDIQDSYSSGGVASQSGNAVGGFVGNDVGSDGLTDDYFDTETSGQSHGAGNDTADPGITGLTTAQFQSGLPGGLSQTYWAEDPGINGGLPYLRNLPKP